MGQSKMKNPDTLATPDTQNTGQRQTKHKNTTQNTKMMRNRDPIKSRGGTRVLTRGKFDFNIIFRTETKCSFTQHL